VQIKRAHKLSHVDIPSFRKIDLKDRIKQFYARILTSLKKPDRPDKHMNKVSYTRLTGKEKEQKLACFLPLLHLSNTRKLWIEQETHLEEIWIYLYQYFEKNKDSFIDELEQDIEEMKQELEQAEAENIEKTQTSGLEKARIKKQEKQQLAEEIRKELEAELDIIVKEEKIEEITGFGDET